MTISLKKEKILTRIYLQNGFSKKMHLKQTTLYISPKRPIDHYGTKTAIDQLSNRSNQIMSEKESILHCILRPTMMNDDPIMNKKNKAVYTALVAPRKPEK